jgi:hypothetical protein
MNIPCSLLQGIFQGKSHRGAAALITRLVFYIRSELRGFLVFSRERTGFMRSRFPVIFFLILMGVLLLCMGDLSTPAFSAGPTFLDVPSDHPYYEYIEALYQNNYIA